MKALEAARAALRSAWSRTLGAFTRDRLADEVREEFESHLALEIDDNIRRGMDPAEARRQALISAGGMAQAAEAVRARRGLPWIDVLAADVRYAVRSIRKNPAFTAVVVTTLALGIGANTAVFSVVDGVLLRPLAFTEPNRLVSVAKGGAGGSRGEFLEMRRELDVFEAVGVYGIPEGLSLTGDGEPVRVEAVAVSPGFFGMLGIAPALGRDFVEVEATAGQDAVVILSHALWADRYGRDPGVLGSTLRLDGVTRTVVGVMPPRFPSPAGDPQVWIPTVLAGEYDYYVADMWSFDGYSVVARLNDGVTVDRAGAEVLGLAPLMRERFPWDGDGEYWHDISVAPLQARLVGGVRDMLVVLLGAVAIVLVVACVNVANLLLSRGVARRREIAVRASLGAGRFRIVRQLVTESVLLAGLGGAAGAALAFAAVPFLGTVLPPDLPRLDEVRVDLRVLGFTLGVSLATGMLFGLGPAWLTSRTDVRGMLKEAALRGDSHSMRASSVLVTGQVALAVVLVISAGLLVRSLWNQLGVDPGFETRNMWAATVAPPAFRYADDERMRRFYGDLLEQLEREPGVRSAAVASGLPFGGDSKPYQTIFRIEGRGEGPGDYFFTRSIGTVSPGFFATLGIDLVEGRLFEASDGPDDPPVAVVSRRAAEENWPGQDVIGERFRFIRESTWRTVVGVVEDVKWGDLTEDHGSSIYVPLTQGRSGVMQIVVQTTDQPGAVAAGLRAIVGTLDSDTPVSDVRSMEHRVVGSVAGPRATMLLVGLFALLAVILGGVGVYGVVAYTVGRRSHEFGVRRALGADRGNLVGLVVRNGLALAVAGILLGLMGAVVATRMLAGLLYGVGATDPVTFAVVPLLLVVVVLVACWIPARRASRADPLHALKAD